MRIVLVVGLWLATHGSLGADPPEGILFECQREGETPSYLLGTMHSGDRRVMAIARDVRTHLLGARRLVLEIVPDGAALLEALRTGILSDGQRLSDRLDPEFAERVFRAAAVRGIERDAADRMKPWALANLFSLPPDDGSVFLDLRLHQLAEEAGLEVVGLERAAEQLAIFDALSWSAQVEWLRTAVKNLEHLPQQHENLIASYLAGDLATLEAVADEQQGLLRDELADWFEQELIAMRNRRMADRLAPLLEGGGSFVAVGALHLVGESGLYAALERRGCRWRRLR